MIHSFKTKFENFHLIGDRIIITRDRTIFCESEIGDLNVDYQKSKNDLKKSLIAMTTGILIFSILTAYSISQKMLHPSLWAISFLLMYLYGAFYTLYYTSGTPKIEREQIISVKIKGHPLKHISIKYNDNGYVKKRNLPLSEDLSENEKVHRVLRENGLIH